MTRQQLLTPPGTGAIATLEVAGPEAWTVVRSLFRPASGRPLTDRPALHRVWFGLLGGATGDEVVLAVRGVDPPVLEIHSHGGLRVVRWLTDLLARHGATTAWSPEPSAWSLLEHAPTLRTAGILLDQCQGTFAKAVRDPANLTRLAALAPVGRHLVSPWKVVVAGAPNVGKSSLVNAIAGYQRSITSPVAGTTRDVVTTVTALDGWPVELADTAGLRAPAENLEATGIELAQQFVREADLTVWLIDGTDPNPVWPGPDDGDPDRRLTAANKADQPTASDLPGDTLRVSAATGTGVPELIAAVVARLVASPPGPGEAVPYTPALADLVEAAYADPATAWPLLARVASS